MKAATFNPLNDVDYTEISIHAAREGGDDYKPFNVETLFVISIHAAREGGDIVVHQHHNRVRISIHAAREGGDSTYGSGLQ